MTTHQAPGVNLWTKTFFGMGQGWHEPSDLYFGFVLRSHGPAPELVDLRAHVAARAQLVPALCHEIRTSGDQLTWVREEAFDAADHVQIAEPPPDGLSPAQVLLGSAPRKPLWGLWLVPRPAENRWELYYLCHHALLDASGALRALQILLGRDKPPATTVVGPSRTFPRILRTVLPGPAVVLDVLATYRPSEAWGPLGDAEGQQRTWSSARVATDTLKAIGAARGATVNQVHLAAMAVALGRLDRERGVEPLVCVPGGRLHVVVPLDTRRAGESDESFGNHLGLLRVPLETGAPSPLAALDAVKRTTARRRIERWKRFWCVTVNGAGQRLANWVHLRVAHPTRSALTVSGLRIPAGLGCTGRPFDQVVPLPWLPPGSACFTLLASYEGTTTMSVLTHGGTFAPERLAILWETAVEELRTAVSGLTPPSPRTNAQGRDHDGQVADRSPVRPVME